MQHVKILEDSFKKALVRDRKARTASPTASKDNNEVSVLFDFAVLLVGFDHDDLAEIKKRYLTYKVDEAKAFDRRLILASICSRGTPLFWESCQEQSPLLAKYLNIWWLNNKVKYDERLAMEESIKEEIESGRYTFKEREK